MRTGGKVPSDLSRPIGHDICMRMATETHIYGEWPSPIDGAEVARKQVSLAFPVIDAAGVWWQESRPQEGGRVTVVCQGPDGGKRDLLPMPWNARTRVHEYGGMSYLPLPDGLVFANFADQRLYRCWGAGPPARPTGPRSGSWSAARISTPTRRRHRTAPGWPGSAGITP